MVDKKDNFYLLGIKNQIYLSLEVNVYAFISGYTKIIKIKFIKGGKLKKEGEENE